MNPLLAKIQAYLLTGAACLAVGFGAGWTVHGWQMKASLAHQVQTQAHQVVQAVQKQDKITANVEAADAQKQQQIHAAYARLQQEVPKHVTPDVDRQFPVSDRLVGVLDRALAVPAVPDAAGSADGAAPAASTVAESDLGAWATLVIEQYNSTRQQLIDLQAWVQAQESGRIPKEVSMVDWQQLVKDGKAEMVGGRLYQNRVEVGRLVDGKFVEHEGAADEAAAAPAVQADSTATVNTADARAADKAREEDAHAEVAAKAAAPAERPAVDAAAMLGD